MMSLAQPLPWLLAAATAALNLPLGRLRANATRRSHRWFGLLAAPVFLLLALRHAFALAWIEALPLATGMLAGQFFGRRMAQPGEPSPLRWRTAAYAALVAGLLLFIGAPAQAKSPNQWDRLDANEPAPAFSLTDQSGRRTALTDFRGRVVIVTFLFTNCTDVCPVLPQMLARVDQLLSDAEKAKLAYVGISIDPRRDTPQRLREFIKSHGLDASRWTLLTGSVKELTKAANDYGVVVRPDPRLDFVHNTVFVLIDGKGRLRTEFHGLATPTDEIAKAARALMAPPAKKR
ncbi:MAG: SCO family protein [Rhodocyclales bacterium]|nr:SCO family protein [Rhodocyclales bacterium]